MKEKKTFLFCLIIDSLLCIVFSHKVFRCLLTFFFREMFSHHFPSPSAKKTVPIQGKSIACSTEAAIKWDASFQNLADPSGRAVCGVHEQG